MWKKLSADVFRKPKCGLVLSVLAGSGIQVLVLFFLLVFCLMNDFEAPMLKTDIEHLFYLIAPLFGLVNGFVSARFYMFFNGSEWLLMQVSSCLLLPLIFTALCFTIEICQWVETERTAQLPIST